MKKYLLIVFILTPFITFSGEKEVASFIGLSFGYVQNNLSDYDYDTEDTIQKNLFFDFSSRFGITDKINNNLSLYYFALLEIGPYLHLGGVSASFGEINIGTDIKCNYKKFNLGLAIGAEIPLWNYFLRPSIGYNLLKDNIIEFFIDYRLPVNYNSANSGYKIGFAFYVFI